MNRRINWKHGGQSLLMILTYFAGFLLSGAVYGWLGEGWLGGVVVLISTPFAAYSLELRFRHAPPTTSPCS